MRKTVVNKSIPWKRGRGAPEGNQNAAKRMTLPEWLHLDDPESILKFMREILIPYTLAERIGTRQSSAITTACKVLLEYDLRELEERLERLEKSDCEIKEQIEKAQLIKTRTGIEYDIHAAQDREVKAVLNFMKEMPPSLRNACMEFIREKAKTEQSTAT